MKDFTNAKQYLLNQYDNIYKIVLEETTYMDGNYAIAMYNWDDDLKFWDHWDVLTTNLPQSSKSGKTAYIDTDKYLNFVLGNKLGIVTGNVVLSGYKHYTEIKFKEVL